MLCIVQFVLVEQAAGRTKKMLRRSFTGKTLHGQYRFFPDTPQEIVVPNLITDEGEESFLKQIMQADVIDVSAGGNWFLGLCEETPAETDTLVSITTEPTSAGGYARQPFARNTTGVPTVELINDAHRAISLALVFAASGANFSRSIQRAFLCNVVSGTSGILYSYSGLLPNSITVQDGANITVKYELFLR